MRRRGHALVFALATLVLLLAHVFAPADDGTFLGIAWLPWDLGYHLAWILVASGLVIYMTNFVWPEAE